MSDASTTPPSDDHAGRWLVWQPAMETTTMTMQKPTTRHQLRPDIEIDIEGVFRATVEVEATPDIAIERHLHLRREPGGTWILYIIPNGAVEVRGEIASGDIDVNDPAICSFLDSFYCLLADPDRLGDAAFGSDATPVSTEGT